MYQHLLRFRRGYAVVFSVFCIFVFARCGMPSSSFDWSDDYDFRGGSDEVPNAPSRAPIPSHLSLDTNVISTTVKIEEADMVKRHGRLLFYLHVYRGLTIFNMEDPAKPVMLGTAPVLGLPVEMFVTPTTAYVLVQNVLDPLQHPNILDVRVERDESQLIIIDIRNPAKPVVLSTFLLKGDMRRGLSVKRGKYLYVTTFDKSQSISWTGPSYLKVSEGRGSWMITSLDISDPSKPRLVQRIPVMGGRETEAFDTALLSFPKDPAPASGSTSAPPDAGSPDSYDGGSWSSPDSDSSESLQGRFKQNSPSITEIRPNKLLSVVLTAVNGHVIVTENWRAETKFKLTAIVPVVQKFRKQVARNKWEERVERREEERDIPFTMNQHFSVINVFDVRELDGKAILRARFRVQGVVTDRFKQFLVTDAPSKTNLFVVVRRNRLMIAPHFVWTDIENAVLSFSLSAASLSYLDDLPFGKEKETVRGSYFDTTRKALYAITATGHDSDGVSSKMLLDLGGKMQAPRGRKLPTREEREKLPPDLRDPLYAIDLSDPRSLRLRSFIDNLSGDIQLFRPVNQGQYLIAVGRDTSSECTGFDPGTNTYSRTAVSLVDVRDLNKIRLVQRRCVATRPDIKVVNSNINWDRDEAHKLIGLYEHNGVHLVSVPVVYTETVTDPKTQQTSYPVRSAVGLMRWDISKDKPELPAKDQKVLEDLGTMQHPLGQIERTMFWDYLNQTHPLVAVNLSQESMVSIDLTDLKQPTKLAQVKLTSYTDAVYQLGSHLLVQAIDDTRFDPMESPLKSDLGRRWTVHAIDANTGQPGPALQTFSVQNVSSALLWKQQLLIFQDVEVSNGNGTSKLTIVDVTTPQAPKQLPPVTLTYPIAPMTPYVLASPTPPTRDSQTPGKYLLTDKGIVLLHSFYTPGVGRIWHLLFLDLQDNNKPTLQKLTALPIQLTETMLWAGQKSSFSVTWRTLDNTTQKVTDTIQRWKWDSQSWKAEEAFQLPEKATLLGILEAKDNTAVYVFSRLNEARETNNNNNNGNSNENSNNNNSNGNGNGNGNSNGNQSGEKKYILELLKRAAPDAKESWSLVHRITGTPWRTESPPWMWKDTVYVQALDRLTRYQVTPTKLEMLSEMSGNYKYNRVVGASGEYLLFSIVGELGQGLAVVHTSFGSSKKAEALCFFTSYRWQSKKDTKTFDFDQLSHITILGDTAYAASGRLGLQTCDLRQSHITHRLF